MSTILLNFWILLWLNLKHGNKCHNSGYTKNLINLYTSWEEV